MLNIRRFYSKNRRTIWIVVISFILVMAVLQILNNNYKRKDSSSTNESATTVNNSYSVITGEKIEEEKGENINKIIANFFEYCNNGNVSKAYELLSKDCKEELYKTEEDFKNKYVDTMFKIQKIYNSQSWISNNDIGNTYRIEISEDVLSSGKVNSNTTEEYFTIVKENEEYKLNINSYVGKQEINKTIEENNIEITVISKQVYMDYEKYKIKVKNNTKNAILLDGFRNNKSMYLLDTKCGKKIAMLNELTMQELLVRRNLSITKEIKFNREYTTNLEITSLVFEDIILNYNEYKNLDNKDSYKNALKMEISI